MKDTSSTEGGAVMEWLNDYWHFLLFAGTSVAGFWLGAERTKWRLEAAIKTSARLEERIDRLEKATETNRDRVGAEAVTLAKIDAKLEAAITAIGDMRKEMQGKVDK